MNPVPKRTQRDYSLAFKLAVVDQVEKGEMTYKQAKDRFGIQGASTVLVWLRKHRRLDWSSGTPAVSKAMTDQPQDLTPEQRIKELEKQLRETQQKAEFFEEIVHILKRDYGVQVKKPRPGSLNKNDLSVTRACHYLGISRQAYYQQQQRDQRGQQTNEQVLQQVMGIRRLHPRLGTRKLHYLLKRSLIVIGRDKLFDLLQDNRLLITPIRSYQKTTLSHHRFRRHPNLLKQGVKPERPEQVWVADITYLPTRESEGYLSLVSDA